ncbi:MAG: DUF4126 domain-containing protein [Alphaproteobacteria bacterium]|jgi:hypothetical protein|nr:DUF4126 domain-containing protein [Alphaproteobacteria bacterium]
MEALETVSLALGAAWASGINLYAAVLLLGLADAFGLYALPSELQVLASPAVLITAGILYGAEFIADKIPGFDTFWDTLHAFVRIPAGALLAAGAVADVGETYQVVAALIVGAALAAGSHATKAGGRAVINTSPEPFTNWIASIGEDVLVAGGLILAMMKPAIFLICLAVFVLLLLWLLPKLWRGIRQIVSGLSSPFRRSPRIGPD